MINGSTITKVAFASLFHTWNRKVYHYALSKTGSSYIAEETVQRTFIKLWDNLQHKNIVVKVEAQLFMITRSVMLDIIKEERRRQLAMSRQETREELSPTPFDHYRLKELQEQLDQLINTMPEGRKRVFQLHRQQNLSYKQIAELLSISPKTVESHIHLALKALKKNFFFFFILFILFFTLS